MKRLAITKWTEIPDLETVAEQVEEGSGRPTTAGDVASSILSLEERGYLQRRELEDGTVQYRVTKPLAEGEKVEWPIDHQPKGRPV